VGATAAGLAALATTGADAAGVVWPPDRSEIATRQKTPAAMPDQTLYAVRTVCAIPPTTIVSPWCRGTPLARYPRIT